MQAPVPLSQISQFLEINDQTPQQDYLQKDSSSRRCAIPNKCLYPTPFLPSTEHQFLTCNACPRLFHGFIIRLDYCRFSLVLLNIFAIFTESTGFYLPGLAPVNFCEAPNAKPTCPNNVTLFVNKLDSDQSVIPYEYHSFDFCVGSENESPVENLDKSFLAKGFDQVLTRSTSKRTQNALCCATKSTNPVTPIIKKS
uniref:Uncharacterized protein n=1 Tax=Ditylenchus dipsaci TaxID=166011 RepID=A0A915EA23_9BILA